MIENILRIFASPFGGSWVSAVAVILLAVAGLAALCGPIFRAEKDVQRRIQGGRSEGGVPLRKRVDGALAAMGSRLGAEGPAVDVKVLRGKLIRAGYAEPQAVLIFFAIRLLCAAALAIAAAAGLLLATSFNGRIVALACVGLAILGYLIPALVLDRMVNRATAEHREGFPDMMDLMVVCAQAGLSMEAGLQRISMELAPAYPSLGRNLEWAVREIRSGKPLSKAIESMALRLGIDEALSFSTLLQQSEELGSSLTQSLRAYSDDMRHKRMMKAEEKAYALPAKMVVPLTLFVFPVLFVVIMLPVVISVMAARM